jgi:hypothetical protein
MTQAVVPLPVSGDVFPDARGTERGLRVSWHTELGLVVVSLWRENTCVGTLQLPRDEVPRLITALANGLVEAPAASAQNPRRAS